jgi:uncharacterized protein (TIRG00374 family)
VGICSIKKENKVKVKPTFEKNKITKKICYSIVISLGTMVFIFSYFSYRETTVPDLSFKIIPLIAGALCMIGAWIFDALRIFITVRAWGKAILFRDSLRSVLSAYFMSSITPFMIGGGPAQMYVLGRSGLTWGEAGSLVVVCGILYQVSLLLLIVVFIFLFDIRVALQGILLKLLYTFAIFYSIIMFLLFYFLYRPQVLYCLTNWGINFVKRYFRKAKFSEAAVRAWVEEFFDDFRRGFSILFLKKPQYLAWNLGCYIIYFILFFSVGFCILKALGVNSPYLRVISAQIPLYYIFGFIPTPGASGGVELTVTSVFLRFAGPQRVGMYILLWRIATFYFPLFLGGYAFFRIITGTKKPTVEKYCSQLPREEKND